MITIAAFALNIAHFGLAFGRSIGRNTGFSSDKVDAVKDSTAGLKMTREMSIRNGMNRDDEISQASIALDQVRANSTREAVNHART